MMLPIITDEDLPLVQAIAEMNLELFADDDNTRLRQAIEADLGHPMFADSKFPMPELTLDTSQQNPEQSDFANVKAIHQAFTPMLTDSTATDERLWTALSLGPYWGYVQYRWDVKNKHSRSNILQHYFFAYGPRRSLTRNAVARLWRIGRLTYDENAKDPYELTEWICQSKDYIIGLLERNFSNNLHVFHPFIRAIMDAQAAGLPGATGTRSVRVLAKYLNELGGTYILDCLPEQTIHDKVYQKAAELRA